MASDRPNAYSRIVVPFLKKAPWMVKKMRLHKERNKTLPGYTYQTSWYVRCSFTALDYVVAIRRNCRELRHEAIHALRVALGLTSPNKDLCDELVLPVGCTLLSPTDFISHEKEEEEEEEEDKKDDAKKDDIGGGVVPQENFHADDVNSTERSFGSFDTISSLSVISSSSFSSPDTVSYFSLFPTTDPHCYDFHPFV